MRAVVDRGPFLAAMGRLIGVVERRQTIPILGNVYIGAGDGILQLRATDLDMELIETVAAEIAEPGETTLSAERLHDIARNADPGARITIAVGSESRGQVIAGRSRFTLPLCSPADFPTFRSDGFGEPWTLPARTLANMISRVSFARGVSPSLFAGLYLVASDDELHAVACHQAGIALRREPLPVGSTIAAILPPKLVDQIARWLSDADGDATVCSSDALIRISHDGATLTGKLLDGSYFDYRRALLEGQDNAALTDQDALSAAIKRVAAFNESKAGSIRIVLADGDIELSARSDLAGEGIDEVGCAYDGPKGRLLMHAGRLQDAIAALSGDSIEIGFCPELDPEKNTTGQVVIRNPSDPGLLINLMQTRA